MISQIGDQLASTNIINVQIKYSIIISEFSIDVFRYPLLSISQLINE